MPSYHKTQTAPVTNISVDAAVEIKPSVLDVPVFEIISVTNPQFKSNADLAITA